METGIVAVILLLDQLTKYQVQRQMALGESIEIIPDFFYLTYVRNTGAAWSLLAGKQFFLSLLAAVAIGVMLSVLLRNRNLTRLFRLSLVLMIAGALGNLIDRLWFGAVRDFLNFYPFGYNFPIFNVADISLCFGVGLMILDAFVSDRKKEERHENI